MERDDDTRARAFIGASLRRSSDAGDRLSSPGSDASNTRHVGSVHTASCVVFAGRLTHRPPVFVLT